MNEYKDFFLEDLIAEVSKSGGFMKVIKEGKWNLPWSKEYNCATCEAQLLVEEADVKPKYNDYGYHFICSICTKSNDIKKSEIPLRLAENVDTKREWATSFNDR